MTLNEMRNILTALLFLPSTAPMVEWPILLMKSTVYDDNDNGNNNDSRLVV
jgi:hypothetical protein